MTDEELVYTIRDTTLTAIADAIRDRTNTTEDINPLDMPQIIKSLLKTTDRPYPIYVDFSNKALPKLRPVQFEKPGVSTQSVDDFTTINTNHPIVWIKHPNDPVYPETVRAAYEGSSKNTSDYVILGGPTSTFYVDRAFFNSCNYIHYDSSDGRIYFWQGGSFGWNSTGWGYMKGRYYSYSPNDCTKMIRGGNQTGSTWYGIGGPVTEYKNNGNVIAANVTDPKA